MKKNLNYKVTDNKKLIIDDVPIHPLSIIVLLIIVLSACTYKESFDQKSNTTASITEALAPLSKSPSKIITSEIKTIKPEFKKLAVPVQANGVIAYDDRTTKIISARIGGRIEHITIKYQYQPIRKGERIAEIYSPELITSQRELLFIAENDAANLSLLESAKNRLRLLGTSDSQINALLKHKKVNDTFSLISPYTGFVINAETQQRMFRKGDYIATEQTLFKVVNNAQLWAEISLPAQTASGIKVGDSITIVIAQQSYNEQINFIEPYYAEGEPFVRVRSYLHRVDAPLIGSFISTTIHRKAISALWVPTTAIIHTGEQAVVFVKEKGRLRPQSVTIGWSADERTQIISGLTSADEIALDAHYLIDSESNIKAN